MRISSVNSGNRYNIKYATLFAVTVLLAVVVVTRCVNTASGDLVFVSDLNIICDRSQVSLAFSPDPSDNDKVFISVSCSKELSGRSVTIKVEAIRDAQLRDSAIKKVLAELNDRDNAQIDIMEILRNAGWKTIRE